MTSNGPTIQAGVTPDPALFDYVYLSLGAGVQSSALYIMCALGLHGIPRVDAAYFADTQDEPWWVYEQLCRLAEWGMAHDGPPIIIVTEGKLSESSLRMLRIPAWTQGTDGTTCGVPTRRQCTREYKINPIQRSVRRAMGVKHNERVKTKRALSLHGISVEELYRVKPARERWLHIDHPLIWRGIDRARCVEVWREHLGEPLPRRSACVYCPYRRNEEWRDIRDDDPAGWQFAVEYDKRIRNSTQAGIERPVYLHRSLQPLSEVDLTEDKSQADLFMNECEGMCGV